MGARIRHIEEFKLEAEAQVADKGQINLETFR